MSKKNIKIILMVISLSLSPFSILGVDAMNNKKTDIKSTNTIENLNNNQKKDILNNINKEKNRLNDLINKENKNADCLNKIIICFIDIYKIIEKNISKNNFIETNILNKSNLEKIELIKENLENTNIKTTPPEKYNKTFDDLFYKIYDEISKFKKICVEKQITLTQDEHYNNFKNTVFEIIKNFNKNIKNTNNSLEETSLNKINEKLENQTYKKQEKNIKTKKSQSKKETYINFNKISHRELIDDINNECDRISELKTSKKENGELYNNIISNFLSIYDHVKQSLNEFCLEKKNILNKINFKKISLIKELLKKDDLTDDKISNENSEDEISDENSDENSEIIKTPYEEYNDYINDNLNKIYNDISEIKNSFMKKNINLSSNIEYQTIKNELSEIINKFAKTIKKFKTYVVEIKSMLKTIYDSKSSIDFTLNRAFKHYKWYLLDKLSLENETKKVYIYIKQLFKKIKRKIIKAKFNSENLFDEKYYEKIKSLIEVINNTLNYENFIHEVDNDFYKTKANNDPLNFEQTIRYIDFSLSNISKLLNNDKFNGYLNNYEKSKYYLQNKEIYKKKINTIYFSEIKELLKEICKIYTQFHIQYKLINGKYKKIENTDLNHLNYQKYISTMHKKIKNYNDILNKFSNKPLDENDKHTLKNLKQEILDFLDKDKIMNIDNLTNDEEKNSLKNKKDNSKEKFSKIKINLKNKEEKVIYYDEREKDLITNVENKLIDKIKQSHYEEYKTCLDINAKELKNKTTTNSQLKELKEKVKHSLKSIYHDINSHINILKNQDIKDIINRLENYIDSLINEEQNQNIYLNLKNMFNIINEIVEKDLFIEENDEEMFNIIQNNKENFKIISFNKEYFEKFKKFCNNIKTFGIFNTISIKKNRYYKKNSNSFVSKITNLNNIFHDIAVSILKLKENSKNYKEYKNILLKIYKNLNFIIHYFNTIKRLNNLITDYKNCYTKELKKIDEELKNRNSKKTNNSINIINKEKENNEKTQTEQKIKNNNLSSSKKLETKIDRIRGKINKIKPNELDNKSLENNLVDEGLINKNSKKTNNSINIINEETENDEKTQTEQKIKSNNLKSLEAKIIRIRKKTNKIKPNELDKKSLKNQLEDINNKINAINSISNVKKITEQNLIDLSKNLNSSNNISNNNKNISKINNTELTETDQNIFKKIIKNFKNYLMGKKQLFEKFINDLKNNNRFKINSNAIIKYKEIIENLMKIIRDEKSTYEEFNNAKSELRKLCITTEGKIDLKKMIEIFKDKNIINEIDVKGREYFFDINLRKGLEDYLSGTNKELEKKSEERLKKYQAENPNVPKTLYLPYTLKKAQEKFFKILENMINDIKKLIENLNKETNIENLKNYIEDYKTKFFNITYFLSLTPTNQLSIPQLHMVMRKIEVEEHKEDLKNVDIPELITWFDGILTVLFNDPTTYQRFRDNLKNFKKELEVTFEDFKNGLINIYKQNKNLEKKDIIKAYVNLLKLKIYCFKAELDSFNSIKNVNELDRKKINKKTSKELAEKKEEHLKKLDKITENNLKEFKQLYDDVLSNICLTNSNEFSEEIFKKAVKKMNLIDEKDINSLKINEINYNEHIEEIIQLKKSLYESIEKFKLKYEDIAKILTEEEQTSTINENVEIKQDEIKEKDFDEKLRENKELKKELEMLKKEFNIEMQKKQELEKKALKENSEKLNQIKNEMKNLKQTSTINEKFEKLKNLEFEEQKLKEINDEIIKIKNIAESKLENLENIIKKSNDLTNDLKNETKPQNNIINTNNAINNISKEQEEKIKSSLNYIFKTLQYIPNNTILQNFNDDDLNNFNYFIEKINTENQENDDSKENQNKIIINNNSDNEKSEDEKDEN